MTIRAINAHAPALTLQEAAMLPALQPMRDQPRVPKNLAVSSRHLDFRPVRPDASQLQPDIRRGCAAGRAVLRAAGVTLPGLTAIHVRKK